MAPRAAVLLPADDATLAARAKAGDRAAFDELYGRHARYIAGVVFRLMGDRGELADVVQESFLAALESVHRLRHPEFVRTWLVGIAVRRVRRHLHRRTRTETLRRLFSPGVVATSDPTERAPVDELRRALDGVPPQLSIPWVLHKVEGETLPEVARIEGVSLATIKRRIAAADAEIERRLA